MGINSDQISSTVSPQNRIANFLDKNASCNIPTGKSQQNLAHISGKKTPIISHNFSLYSVRWKILIFNSFVELISPRLTQNLEPVLQQPSTSTVRDNSLAIQKENTTLIDENNLLFRDDEPGTLDQTQETEGSL